MTSAEMTQALRTMSAEEISNLSEAHWDHFLWLHKDSSDNAILALVDAYPSPLDKNLWKQLIEALCPLLDTLYWTQDTRDLRNLKSR